MAVINSVLPQVNGVEADSHLRVTESPVRPSNLAPTPRLPGPPAPESAPASGRRIAACSRYSSGYGAQLSATSMAVERRTTTLPTGTPASRAITGHLTWSRQKTRGPASLSVS